MLKLDTRIDLNFEKFLRWWGGELAFFIPQRLLKLLGGGRARLVLMRTGEGLSAAYFDGDGVRELGLLPLDESAPGKRGQLLAENPGLDNAELVLRLRPEQSMARVFKLPAIAEENLQQVTAFEMDRLTPFTAGQVYFDVKLLDRLAATRQIRVELALAPRKTLDALLDELIPFGWRPERVDLERGHDTLGHNLMPEKFRPPKSRLPKIITVASAALSFSLLLAVLGLPILMNQRLLDELQTQVKAVGKVAKEVQELRENAEKLSNENGFLLQKKRHEPVMTDMLDELTKVIPDQTSLNGLQYREHKVIIQGQSPAASSLIERMEASTHFKNTSFVSPVTKDVSNGQERFQIASEVTNGRFSENKPE
ncbi:MAG: PilN domain-containing protein [Candidatus Methylumidiphilus sp.]